MDQTYMKEKPVVPLLLSMGIPVIISMIAGALYNIVDSIFVAMISEDAMTAVRLSIRSRTSRTQPGLGLALVSMRWWRDALAKEKHGWRTRQHRREYF